MMTSSRGFAPLYVDGSDVASDSAARALARYLGLIFWDLPMTLLLRFSNIHRRRGRETCLLNSIQLGSKSGFCRARRARCTWGAASQVLPID